MSQKTALQKKQKFTSRFFFCLNERKKYLITSPNLRIKELKRDKNPHLDIPVL